MGKGCRVNLESGEFRSLSYTEVLTAFSKRIDNCCLSSFVADSSVIVLPPHSYHLHNLELNPEVPIELKLDWSPHLVHGGFLVGEKGNQLIWIDCQDPKLEKKSTEFSNDTSKSWSFLHSDDGSVYFVSKDKSGFLLTEFTTIDREFVRVRELELPQRPILVNKQIVCATEDLREVAYHDRNTGKLMESFTVPNHQPSKFEIQGKWLIAEQRHEGQSIFSIDQKRWLRQHSNPDAYFSGTIGDYSIYHINDSVDLISNSNGHRRTIEVPSTGS